jgi:hypothetical protein
MDRYGLRHLIVYTLGLPIFRTLAFTVGFLAQAVLALAIFKLVWAFGPRGQATVPECRVALNLRPKPPI